MPTTRRRRRRRKGKSCFLVSSLIVLSVVLMRKTIRCMDLNSRLTSHMLESFPLEHNYSQHTENVKIMFCLCQADSVKIHYLVKIHIYIFKAHKCVPGFFISFIVRWDNNPTRSARDKVLFEHNVSVQPSSKFWAATQKFLMESRNRILPDPIV